MIDVELLLGGSTNFTYVFDFTLESENKFTEVASLS